LEIRLPERLRSGTLLADSTIVFSASMVGNVFNYLFQVYVGRTLGPEGYGTFGALISILTILGLPAYAITLTLAKFVSQYSAEGKKEKVSSLIRGALVRISLYGMGIALLFLMASPFLGGFLQIPSITPFLLIALTFLFALLLAILQGVLQGLQRFLQYSGTSVLGPGSKFLFALLLLSFGFGVNGALGSLLFSAIVQVGVILFLIREYLTGRRAVVEKSVFDYSTPTLLAVVSLTLLWNIDMVLVKHFFSPMEAGYYAAAALFGRIVFFASTPIAFVAFPKASRREGVSPILREGLLYTSLLSFGIVGFYFLFPYFTISLIFGPEYGPVASYIVLLGIAMTFYSLSNFLITYDLAVKRMGFLYPLLLSVGVEALLLWVFPASLFVVVEIVVLTMGALLLSLLFLNREGIFQSR
jgi:O-antigen/teichoic acid export membrane protein